MAPRGKRTTGQIILRLLFVAYVGWMLWLLFGQRLGAQSDMVQAAQRLNLKPFATVHRYFPLLMGRKGPALQRLAVINLVGNVVMFIPFGYCIPRIFSAFRGFFPTFFMCFIMITVVEAVQYFTGLGVCDIDDLILNLFGVIIGYLLSLLKRH